jgi:hypothetical protein
VIHSPTRELSTSDTAPLVGRISDNYHKAGANHTRLVSSWYITAFSLFLEAGDYLQMLTAINNKNRYKLKRALSLGTQGEIPAGAFCTAYSCLAYGEEALSLHFEEWWPALAQWGNELLLFPDCVDVTAFIQTMLI